MMRPFFAVLRHSYPSRSRYPRAKLLELLGWDDLLKNHAFDDTCAMRMSAALALSGVDLIGARMKGKAGELKGKRIEPGQAALSRILRDMWGKPEKFRSESAARAGIARRSGVVSFFQIDPGASDMQGHIDIIEPTESAFSACMMSCYFSAREIWFWPLK